MHKYLIITEKSGDGFHAYSPDIPGCDVMGGTVDEVEDGIIVAMRNRLRDLADAGEPEPVPTTVAAFFVVLDLLDAKAPSS